MKRLEGIVSLAAVVLALVSTNAVQATMYNDAMNINFSSQEWGGSYGGVDGAEVDTANQENNADATSTAFSKAYWNNLRHEWTTSGGGAGVQWLGDSVGGGSKWKLSDGSTDTSSVYKQNGSSLVTIGNGAGQFYLSIVATRGNSNDPRYETGTATPGLSGAHFFDNSYDGLWDVTLHNVTTGVGFGSYEVWGFVSHGDAKDPTTYAWVNLSGATPISTADVTVRWSTGVQYSNLGAIQILESGGEVPEPGTWMILGGSLLGLCVGGFRRFRKK